MFKVYDPANWFWVVGANEKQVYSSAKGKYVSVSDSNYAEWKQADGVPTKIATEAELKDVLLQQYPAGATGII